MTCAPSFSLALRSEPSERYSDAGALAVALEETLGSAFTEPKRSVGPVAFAIGGVLVLAGAVGLFMMREGDSPSEAPLDPAPQVTAPPQPPPKPPDPPPAPRVRSLQERAQDGDPKAIYLFGTQFAEKTPPDREAALSWYRRGAEAGQRKL